AVGAFFIIRIIIQTPLNELTKLANSFLENDYSQRTNIKTSDEFNQLGDVFNRTAIQIGILLKEIKDSSTVLDNKATELTSAISESQVASEQISASSEEFSIGAEQISEKVNNIVEEINEMVASVQEIASSVEYVDNSATNVTESLKRGTE
ncbi:methyl-accepting chemotaxis protein, partial [Pseudomonas sp. 2822-17]|uniref:HAMP domain-containing protein n=1 Tax=Pseudomonas sp. 2822-17 TaxID=1712678 RepID=UPI00130478C7